MQKVVRGRRPCYVLYNPPLVHRMHAQISESPTGLTACFEGLFAGVSARMILDNGASDNIVDAKFARRIGLHSTASSPTEVSLADGHTVASTVQTVTNLCIQQFCGKVKCHVTDLSLPFDVILGEAFMREMRAGIQYGSAGAEALTLVKGSCKLRLHVAPKRPAVASPVRVSALHSIGRHVKTACKCFTVTVKHSRAEQDDHVEGLVPQETVDTITAEFADVFQPQPPGLPPERGIGHMIPLEPGQKAPYRQPYRLSPLATLEVKKQVEELLNLGWIQPSKSPYGSSIPFRSEKGW